MAFFLRGDPELVDQRLVLVAVQTLAPAVLAGHVFLDAPVEGAERAPGPVAPLDQGIALAGQGHGFILEIVRAHLAGSAGTSPSHAATKDGEQKQHRHCDSPRALRFLLARRYLGLAIFRKEHVEAFAYKRLQRGSLLHGQNLELVANLFWKVNGNGLGPYSFRLRIGRDGRPALCRLYWLRTGFASSAAPGINESF